MPKQEKKPSRYAPEMAGSIFEANVPRILATATLAEAETLLIKNAASFDSINYIYVVDDRGVLVGVFSIKEHYMYERTTPVRTIMTKNPATVGPRTDQEHVALLAIQKNIKAVPVVNADGVLLGVVPPDTINEILHMESVEDTLRFAGSSRFHNPVANIIHAGALFHFVRRVPWLVLGLVGGIAAAVVVRGFESSLQENLVLAAFIPAVVYMADAVGSQAQIIFIRALALSRTLNIAAYLWREIGIGVLLGVSLGALSILAVGLWIGMPFGLVFGVTIFFTIIAAVCVAIGLPWLLRRVGLDPAIASGPFATVVRDILSILIYFGLAQLLL